MSNDELPELNWESATFTSAQNESEQQEETEASAEGGEEDPDAELTARFRAFGQ